MKESNSTTLGWRTRGLLLAAALAASGCGKEETSKFTPQAEPPKPQEAATQLQQAFVNSAPEVKSTAATASQALQAANYEEAVKSLQTMKAKQNLTVDQGMAIYNSERALEARLINAMMAGDPNAKRAYEQLKKSRRN